MPRRAAAGPIARCEGARPSQSGARSWPGLRQPAAVGHTTLVHGGVTAIRPHPGDAFRDRVPAAEALATSAAAVSRNGHSRPNLIETLEDRA